MSPNKRGKDGRTALFAAARQGSESLVALLVSKGARVDDAVFGMTPDEAADGRGYEAVMKILKGRGAKVGSSRPTERTSTQDQASSRPLCCAKAGSAQLHELEALRPCERTRHP